MKLIKKDLKNENIPEKFIKKFDGRLFGLVILLPDTEPLHLIECLRGFWLTYEFGEFLRNEKDKLIVISKKQAEIAKIRYLWSLKQSKKTTKNGRIQKNT